MAKTGIKITTTDTVLGKPIDVNTTSMILVNSEVDTPLQKVRSAAEVTDPYLKKVAEKYFNPADGVSLNGNLLWIGGFQPDTVSDEVTEEGTPYLAPKIRSTVKESFDERPRQILFVDRAGQDVTLYGGLLSTVIPAINTILVRLQEEGIRCVAVIASPERANQVTDCATFNAPFVGFTAMADSQDIVSPDPDTPDMDFDMSGSARLLGLMATLSVGTSVGDGGLSPLSEPSVYISNVQGELLTGDQEPVREMSLARVNELGMAQQLFTRTRPPRNGLWWNDGATCNDSKNALSTLEMARTICAIADDLQSFFVPYINTRVPVTSTGDIQSAYKQVVLDNARAAVVQKYIDNGDISDARINLVAKDNDMIGTRTWEVTLSILPAPTLRWIDGYVFYVNSLE